MRQPLPTLLAVLILGLAGCASTGGSGTPDSRLSDAIWSRNAAKVEKCLKTGNPNGRARSGDTMLMWAYKMENDKAVQLLLDHGANVNNSIETFQMVVRHDNVEHVKLLVSRGADVNARNEPYQQTAIFFARSKAMVEYLLSQGADIHVRDRDGQPPGFEWSAKDPALWAVFVAHGADQVPRDSQGQTWEQHQQDVREAEYQQTLRHNEEIRQDNAWIEKANENMRRQAESVTAAQQREQERSASPSSDPSCGWACQNARAAQEELQRMHHDNAYKGCIAAGGLNCQ